MPKILDERDIPSLMKSVGISNEESGSSIYLDDASEYAINSLVLHGKCKQKTTNGYQLFNANVPQLATNSKGGATVTNNGDGSFTITGSGTMIEPYSVYYYYTHAESVRLLRAGELKLASDKTTKPQLFIHTHLNNTAVTTMKADGVRKIEVTEEQLADETFRIVVGFYANTGDTIVTGTIKPMLYQDGDGTFEAFSGGQPAPNINYPQDIQNVGDEGSVSVFTSGKNLIPQFDVSALNRNGITATQEADGSIILNGTTTTNYSVSSPTIPLLPAGTYTISNISPIPATTWLSVSNEALMINAGNTKKTYTTVQPIKNAKFLIYVDKGTVFNNFVLKPQLEVGSESTKIEDYKGTSAIFPYALNGIPVASGGNYTDPNGQEWICDEVDFEKGVYIKRIHTIELPLIFRKNGNDAMEMWAEINKSVLASNNTLVAQCYCSHFPAVPRQVVYEDSEKEGFCGISTSMNYIRLADNLNFNGDVDALNAWIKEQADSGNPVTLRYALATPVEVALTAEEKAVIDTLKTYKGITNILNSDIGDVTINYVLELKSYIDKKFAELTGE